MSSGPANRLLVFTDLDGTLLDHHDYSWAAAAPALRTLRQSGIPVIPTTSKTLAELADLRRALGLHDHPAIAENGACLDLPPGAPGDITLPGAVPRGLLRAHLDDLREALGCRCTAFHELGTEGIAALTGLSTEQAALANQRQASEPLHWQDDDDALQRFGSAARERGLQVVRGGRFVHLSGPADKGQSMRLLVDAYRHAEPDTRFTCVALGDGPNDLGMLRAADVAVVIPAGHGLPMPLDGHRHVLHAAAPGPRGWAEAMARVLATTNEGAATDG